MPEHHKSTLLRKLRQVDAQPYTIQLNYKNRQHFKTATGGFISLVFYVAAAVVIGLNVYYLIAANQFIFDHIEVKNNLTSIWIDRERFGLLLTGRKNNTEFNLTVKDLPVYGLNVLTQQNQNDNKTYQPIIQGYKTRQYDFSSYLFMNPNCNFQILGSSKLITDLPYRRLGIIVTDVSSNNTQKLDQLKIKFIFINNVINPKSFQPIVGIKTRIFYIRNDLPITTHQTQFLDLYFRKVKVNTDMDKFFESKKVENNYTLYDEQNQNYLYTTNEVEDDRLVVIKLKRSLFTIQYDRNYKKIATYLAETFGVIGLISLIFLIYKGYNRWCFTQNELIPPNHNQTTNIFNYYYSMLRNLKKITVSSQVYDQFQHNLDIHKILQRLDDFEQRLRVLQGRSHIQHQQDYQPQFARKKQTKKNLLLSQSDQQKYL